MQIHATCCAFPDGPAAHAVLLRGPPGSGKSDLALRLIDTGFVLVADDRVDLTAEGGRVIASGPEALAGLIELRGIGILRLPHRFARCPVALVVDFADVATQERMPQPQHCDIAGVALPMIAIDPATPSAAARIRIALAVVTGQAGSRCGALGDSPGGYGSGGTS